MARNTASKYSALSAKQLISDWLGSNPTQDDAEIVARHMASRRAGTIAECRKLVAEVMAGE